MSKEQHQIIDETYENYCKKSESQFIPNFEDGTMTIISPASHYNFLPQQKFINKCKTDTEFSKKWGLKIEERELSLLEKTSWIMVNKPDQIGKQEYLGGDGQGMKSTDFTGTPTKLITITYNDKTIESYE